MQAGILVHGYSPFDACARHHIVSALVHPVGEQPPGAWLSLRSLNQIPRLGRLAPAITNVIHSAGIEPALAVAQRKERENVMLGLWLLGSVAGGLMNPAGAGHDVAAEARCLIKADVEKARVFAASVPNSEVEQQALAAMAIDLRNCGIADLPADVRLVLGGAIAELEIKRYWRAMPIMSRRNIFRLSPEQMDAAGVSEKTLQRTRSWPAAVAIIFCARTRDRRSAEAILRAKPGSSREADEVRRMTPALERCVEKGQVAPLNIATIRAVVARSEYSNGFESDQSGDGDDSLR